MTTAFAPAYDIFFAIRNFVTRLIASETHSLITLKRLMCVLSANVAVYFLAFVETITREMSETCTVIAFESWIDVLKIPNGLLCQLEEVVTFI